jgi:hypothetical protein
MKNKGLFLRISILLVGILFFYKNSTAQCSNFNVSATQTYDGPNKNDATLSPSVTGSSNSHAFSLYKIVNGNYNFIGFSSNTFTNLSAGIYNLNAFDSINKCFDTLTVSITDTGSYNCNQLNLTAVKTYDGSSSNDVTMTLSASGGSGKYWFQIFKYNPNLNLIVNTNTASNLGAGTYKFIVHDSISNCLDSFSSYIYDSVYTVNPCLNKYLAISNINDGNAQNDITIAVNTNYLNLTWYKNGNVIQSGGTSITGQTTGNYTVIAQDTLCLDSSSIYIYDSVYTANPCSTLSAQFYILSDGNNSNDVTLKANYTSSTAQYYWYKNNSAINNNSNILNNATTGTYKLIIYDTVNNCMDSFSSYITDSSGNSSFNCNYFKGDIYHVDSCGTNDLILYASANGSSNYSYLWNNGSTSSIISGLA